jgi:hypothetical protein
MKWKMGSKIEIPLASEQNQIKNGDKLSEGEEYWSNPFYCDFTIVGEGKVWPTIFHDNPEKSLLSCPQRRKEAK